MLEKQFFIGPGDVDPFMDLRLSSLFKFMQDVATEHAEKLGVGMKQTNDRGMFWVITRYSIVILRMPKFLETIVVKTYPGKDMKFIFPRYFQFETLDGEVLIKGCSSWVVLNKENHNINMNPFDGKILPSEHIDGELPLPPKVVPLDNMAFSYQRKTAYSDLDLNGHINNATYINYIVDCHDVMFYKSRQIKRIDINYEHELKSEEELIVSNFINGDEEFINGKTDKKQIFNAKIVYDIRK